MKYLLICEGSIMRPSCRSICTPVMVDDTEAPIACIECVTAQVPVNHATPPHIIILKRY
jgi:hypothetical protein